MSKRAYLIAPLLPLCVLLVVAISLAYTFNVSLDRNRAAAIHARSVMQTASKLLGAAQDAETGQRGYLITGKPAYLEPYEQGVAALPDLLDQLKTLVADDPPQQQRVARLADLAQARIGELKLVLDLDRTQGPEAARERMRGDIGKNLMDQVRALTADILAAEELAFARRRDAVSDYTSYLFAGAIAATLIALLGQGFASWRLLRSHQRLQREMLERGRAEAARRQSDALYRAYFEHAAENLFILRVAGGDCIIEEINPAYARAAGLQAAEVRDKSPADVLQPANAQLRVERCRLCAATGEPTAYEEAVGPAAGRRSWETVLVPVRGEDGSVERIVGSARDVSERKAAEEAKRQSQKMEAIGHLTGGVAHDFNNLLQVVRSHLDLVAADIADRERASQRLRNAIAGADRAAVLTRQLLAFARRQPLEPKVVNLARVVNNVSSLLRHTLGERIEVETVVAGGLWNTLVDPTQVETSLLNLAVPASTPR
jgi:PAS domain S-box-containing protein